MPKAKLPFREYCWTPELAYVVGLLVTDGSLSKNGKTIIFRSSERPLIETFKKCLLVKNKTEQTYHDTFAKKPCYRVQIGNVQFYRWLLSIGLLPAKTYTLGSIKIPMEYFRDFLRGHLDGDGTIFSYRDSYNIYKGKRYENTRIYTKFISASAKHIRWLLETIRMYSPVKGALIHRIIEGKNEMREIKFSKYESLKLFKWLYYKPKLPSLERKRKIAEGLLSRVKNGKLIR